MAQINENVLYFQVIIGDKVVLTPVNANQPLHVSKLNLPDHDTCKEVIIIIVTTGSYSPL